MHNRSKNIDGFKSKNDGSNLTTKNDNVRRRRQLDVKIKTTINQSIDHTKMMTINQEGTMTQLIRKRMTKNKNELIEQVD
jgi:hypothetical protein